MPTIQSGGTLVLKQSATAMGSTVVDRGATVQKPGGLGVVAAGVTLTNDGGITAQGGVSLYKVGGQYYYGETPAANLLNNGVLVNDGQISLGGGAGSYQDYNRSGAPGATLTNAGVLVNIGTIGLDGGRSGGGYFSGGGAGGVLLDTGSLANRGLLTLGGGESGGGIGYDYGSGGAELSVIGSFSNSGVLVLGAGGFSDGGDLAGIGGDVQDSGVFTNSGTITVSAEILYYSPGSEGQFNVSGRLIDTGVIDLATDYNGFHFYYGGRLNIAASGTMSLLGAADIINQGTLTNDGLISGHGTIAGPTLINNGTVLAIGGLLTIDGSIGGNGTFEVGAGGTLDLNGVITEASTVPLTASAAAFAGMVGGVERFGAGGGVDPRDLLPTRELGVSGSWHEAGGGAVLETRQTGAMALVGVALDRAVDARAGGHDGLAIGVHVQ